MCGVHYLVEFSGAVGCCNFYSDASRLAPCRYDDGTIIYGEEASAKLDWPIKMCGIFHIIEWIRTTLMLVNALIGLNVMRLWYYTTVNGFLALACLVSVCYVYSSADAKACEAEQPTRYQWLLVEMIYFLVYWPIGQFPIIILRAFRKEVLHEKILKGDEEEEEGKD